MDKQPTRVDIHDYQDMLDRAQQNIRERNLSPKTKELLLKYDETIALMEGLARPTRTKVISCLARLFSLLDTPRDVDTLTVDELKTLYVKCKDKYHGGATHYILWQCAKKFYRWIEYGDGYMADRTPPARVKWVKSRQPAREMHKVQATDILTEEEVQKLINASINPRDRALVATIYELGARVGEVGGMLRKHVTPHPNGGYLLDIDGKTGMRTPILVYYAPLLRAWLNVFDQQCPNNANMPLWPCMNRGKITGAMTYGGIARRLEKITALAGIDRHIKPHLLRHSRITHIRAKGLLDDAGCRVYFGWTPGSTMLNTYSHLTSANANDKILAAAGLKTQTVQPQDVVRKCQACNNVNKGTDKYCGVCGQVLDEKVALDIARLTQYADENTLVEAIARKVLALGVDTAPDSLRELLSVDVKELRGRLQRSEKSR